jgi:hypothetical protein
MHRLHGWSRSRDRSLRRPDPAAVQSALAAQRSRGLRSAVRPRLPGDRDRSRAAVDSGHLTAGALVDTSAPIRRAVPTTRLALARASTFYCPVSTTCCRSARAVKFSACCTNGALVCMDGAQCCAPGEKACVSQNPDADGVYGGCCNASDICTPDGSAERRGVRRACRVDPAAVPLATSSAATRTSRSAATAAWTAATQTGCMRSAAQPVTSARRRPRPPELCRRMRAGPVARRSVW